MMLEDLITSKSTGSLEELSIKLEMNIDLTKAYIEALEEMRGCKIEYDDKSRSFVFKTP